MTRGARASAPLSARVTPEAAANAESAGGAAARSVGASGPHASIAKAAAIQATVVMGGLGLVFIVSSSDDSPGTRSHLDSGSVRVDIIAEEEGPQPLRGPNGAEAGEVVVLLDRAPERLLVVCRPEHHP